MKIRFVSDLHLNWNTVVSGFEDLDVDVSVFAGDLSDGDVYLATNWIAENASRSKDIIYIQGNHEYYRKDKKTIHDLFQKAKIDCSVMDIRFPESLHEPGCFVKDGIAFIYSTLWTDFCLFGRESMARAMFGAANGMNDYVFIHSPNENGIIEPISPKLTRFFHAENFERMRRLVYDFENDRAIEKIVIVSHHSPSIQSSLAKYRASIITASYASNLEEWILNSPKIKLWIHGHVHNSNDYMIGECRVMSNPRGYCSKRHGDENENFNPNLVVEI